MLKKLLITIFSISLLINSSLSINIVKADEIKEEPIINEDTSFDPYKIDNIFGINRNELASDSEDNNDQNNVDSSIADESFLDEEDTLNKEEIVQDDFLPFDEENTNLKEEIYNVSENVENNNIDEMSDIFKSEQFITISDDYDNAYGYIDADVEFGNLIPTDNNSNLDKTVSFPTSYIVDSLTSVKNQNPFGTCWAHSVIASAESTYLKDTGISLDLSELQLAFYTYNNGGISDPLNLVTNDDCYADSGHGSTGFLDAGGSQYMTMFTLASGIGLNDESDLPYSIAQNEGKTITRSYLNQYLNDSMCYENDYYLTEARIFASTDINSIKKELMDNGAITASYYSNDNYYNASRTAYCYLYDSLTNHAINIVGWDDNYSIYNFNSNCRPESNGAWLVKNSWGTTFGDNGYFWISYEDTSLNNSENEFMQFEIEKNDSCTYIYQHEGTFTKWSYPSAEGEANIYRAQKKEKLQKVGFFTLDASVGYTIEVYLLDEPSSPISGTKVLTATTSGTTVYAGYHTIELNDEVDLQKDQYFSIVIRFNSPISVPIQGNNDTGVYIVSGDYHNGESFILVNSSLYDASLCFEQPMTMMIKAYTSDKQEPIDQGKCGDNAYYTVNEDYSMTITGTGSIYDYTSDNHITDYYNQITSLVIDEDITSIGNYAFHNCSSLTSLTMPASVTIDYNSFTGVSNLTSIHLTKGTGEWTTSSIALTPWYISRSKLQTVILDDGITTIGASAFSNCTSLESIDIPNSIISIGEWAFSSCSSLKSIDIPTSLTYVGNFAFRDCNSLNKVNISSIESWMNIEFVSRESNPLYYARNLYLNNELMTELTIPETVTKLNSYAFIGFSTLKSLTIPISVEMGELPFDGVRDLTHLHLTKGTGEWKILEYTYTPWAFSKEKLQTVIIDDGITSIGDRVFYFCTALESITIPSSVASIGEYAFGDCSSLSKVNISSIEAWANIEFSTFSSNPLYYAHNLYLNDVLLTDITIPNSITSINNYAFYNCSSLTSLTMPASVIINQKSFTGVSNLTTIHLTKGTGEWTTTSYQYTPWYISRSNLETVVLDKGITSIGNYAFLDCLSLSSVTFKGDAPTIGTYAFYNDTLTAYYPSDNPTWTTSVKKQYGGNITWLEIPKQKSLLTLFSSNNARVTGQGEYLEGTSVTVKAINNVIGYNFRGWYRCDDKGVIIDDTNLSDVEEYTFTMPAYEYHLIAIYDSTASFSLKISGSEYKVNGSIKEGDNTLLLNQGTKVTVEYIGDNNFAYWANGSMIMSTNPIYEFYITSDTVLKAVNESKYYKYDFISAYKQVLLLDTYSEDMDIVIPHEPFKSGGSFAGWKIRNTSESYSSNQIAEQLVAYLESKPIDKLIYIDATYTDILGNNSIIISYSGITADPVTKSYTKEGVKNINTNISSPDKDFSYWLMDDKVVSYCEIMPIYLKATETRYVTAVFGEEVIRIPVVYLNSEFTGDNDKAVTFVYSYTRPTGYETVASGVLYSKEERLNDEDKLTIENTDPSIINGKSQNIGERGTYNLTLIDITDKDQKFVTRGYITVKDSNGGICTYYSPIRFASINDILLK